MTEPKKPDTAEGEQPPPPDAPRLEPVGQLSSICDCSHDMKDHEFQGEPYDNWKCGRCKCVHFERRPYRSHALTLTQRKWGFFLGRCICSWSPGVDGRSRILALYEKHLQNVRPTPKVKGWKWKLPTKDKP